MKLFDFGFLAFILFVANAVQFEKDRVRCEKSDYQASGCSVHKKLKLSEKYKG